MKHLPLALAWVIAVAVPSVVRADRGAFVIENFHTDLTVLPDSDVLVEERLVVEFSEPRHGIYRTIPVRYTDRNGFAFSLGFRLLGVLDESGRPYGTKVTNKGRYVKIRIGDPHRTVEGRAVYSIRYRVSDALGSFPEHDELYWNATGHEWNARIGSASATVRLPAPLPSDSLEVASYTGRFGSRLQSARISYPQPGIITFATGALGPLEGLTVAAAWPKGYVSFPNILTRGLRTVANNGILVAPLAALLFLIWLYRRRGRDPQGPDAVVVRYEPPQGVTPGEIGTLLDESVDLRDLTAVVIDLAVRGYLVIRVETRSTLLGLLKKEETVFERNRSKPEADLLPHEKLVLSGLFESADVVDSSDLKEEFYRHIPGIQKALYTHLTQGGYFSGNPSSIRTRYVLLGVMAGVATLLAGIAWAHVRGGIFPLAALVPVIAAVVTVGVFVLFAPAMPRRTRSGVRMRSWALGFAEFVDRVEKDRLRAEEERNVFEKLLPYAMALGVSSKWARKFEGIYARTPPSWYVGNNLGSGFSTRTFEQNLSSSMQRVGQHMTASPRSSGAGGGGSSGGGGGGGGGGSW